MKPEVGAIYELTEKDYRYGIGALLARVTNVLSEAVFDNETWWDVEAVVKAVPNGVGPGQERRMYVRDASLRNSRRATARHTREQSRPAPPLDPPAPDAVTS